MEGWSLSGELYMVMAAFAMALLMPQDCFVIPGGHQSDAFDTPNDQAMQTN